MESRDTDSRALLMVTPFELGRWELGRGALEPAGVPPIHPLGGGELDVLRGAPRSAPTNELGPVQAIRVSASASSQQSAREPTEVTGPSSASLSVLRIVNTAFRDPGGESRHRRPWDGGPRSKAQARLGPRSARSRWPRAPADNGPATGVHHECSVRPFGRFRY